MNNEVDLKQLAEKLGRALQFKHLQLAVAESCTGGELSAVMTTVEGSSAWFERGFIVYSKEAKQELLNVPHEMIDAFGLVSQPVVEAMACGAITNSHADVGIAITGVAGPSGGTETTPVGTVWFGFAGYDSKVKTYHMKFKGDREAIRRQAVQFALEQSLELL